MIQQKLVQYSNTFQNFIYSKLQFYSPTGKGVQPCSEMGGKNSSPYAN